MVYLKYPLLLLLIIINLAVVFSTNDDLYELLEVSKTATTREIRQAFKRLALAKHPDKNQNEPNANEIFMKINRAYEILKDEELRKKYDQFGEKGLHDENRNYNNYQNWNYYQQNFGIYDEDPEIITLSRSDFLQSVDGSSDIWFINFYSTQCSHCHHLAPVWRKLAKELDGVLRIGAVNCLDDWQLCNQQQIQAFPSLLIYPKKEKFHEEQTLENLLKYALSFANGVYYDLHGNTFDSIVTKVSNKMWFISFCMTNDEDDDLNCLDEAILQKLSIMMNGLVNIGLINCNYDRDLCDKLKPPSANLLFRNLKKIDDKQDEIVEITELNHKDIASTMLRYLADLPLLDAIAFDKALEDLKAKRSKAWLVQFVFDYESSSTDLELKKLPSFLTDIDVGRIDCKHLASVCQTYLITKYPTFVLFKRRGLYEFHYGRQSAHDLANFAKENALTNVKSLIPSDFPQILNGNKPVFIDFFAPWCPPCMHLLPQFRKTAKLAGSTVNFGTVDCTVHSGLCGQYNVGSYPTTILFNQTIPHNYHGDHTVEHLHDFIQDILKPSVHILNYESFDKLVAKRRIGQMWLVDFFASWCGPCQQMAPEWRKLSKRLGGVAFVGQVDCVVEQKLCQEQMIQSYPHIRLYKPDSTGSLVYEIYNNNWWRNMESFHQWATSYLPSKTTKLTWSNFHTLVLSSSEPWLVDFYSPWCGPCQTFAPTFDMIATKLDGKVKCGKVNCQEEQYLCQQVSLRHYPTVKLYSGSKSWYGEDIGNLDLNFVISHVQSKLGIRREEL